MTLRPALSARECLPRDLAGGLLIGRAWIPAEDGPSVIAVRGEEAVDLTRSYPTVSWLLNTAKPGDVRAAIKAAASAGSLDAIIGNSVEGHRDASRPWLLAPCDLQAVKVSGVTFIASLLERVTPCSTTPHVRNSRSTNCGRPAPSPAAATAARKASRCSVTT